MRHLYRFRSTLKVSVRILFSAIFLFAFSEPGAAEYRVIHTEPVEYTDLAPGVRHELHQIFTDQGWIEVNVVRSTLDTKQSLVPLYSKNDLMTPKKLSDFVNREDGVVAAINGDFFDYKTKAVLGRIIDRGEVIQTSNRDRNHANFYIDYFGRPAIGYEGDAVGRLMIGDKNIAISYVNKSYTDWDSVLIFDRNFGEKSPEFSSKQIFVTQYKIENNKVTEIIRSNEENSKKYLEIPNGKISDGNFVIYVRGVYATFLLPMLNVGDEVRVEFADLPFTSISGGAQLVKDGRAVEEFTHNVPGKHPRTAIGVEADEKTVLFVTVNGRSSSYRGIRQSELAELMIRLGAYQALVLDGGGSTEMIIFNPYKDKKEIVSFLSDGSERQVFNAISIQNPKATVGSQLLKVRFSKSKINAIAGVPLKLELEAIDSNYQKFDLSTENAVFECIGVNGVFEDGYFVPSAAGDGVISVTSNGIKAYADIHISAHATKLDVREQDGVYRFYLHSDDGYMVELSSRDVNVFVSSDIAQFDSEASRFVPLKNGVSGYATFSYNVSDQVAVTVNVPLRFGKIESVIEDFENFDFTDPEKKGVYLQICKNPGGKGKVAAIDLGDLQGDSDMKHMRYLREYIVVPRDHSALLFDVYASKKSNAKVKVFLGNKDGIGTFVPMIDTVDWLGWKTFKIQNVKKNDEFKILTIQTDRNDGKLYFDNFRLEDEPVEKDPSEIPKNIDLIKKVGEYQIVTQMPVYSLSYDQEGKVMPEFKQKFHYLEINNDGGFIRKHDGHRQWNALLETFKNAAKPVVIKFSSTYYFPDKKAMDLLFRAAETCPQPVYMLFKAYKGQTDIFMNRKVCVIEIKEHAELFQITEDLQVQVTEFKKEQ